MIQSRLAREFDDYTKKLLQKSKEEILESSYKTACLDTIKLCFCEDNLRDLSEEKKITILNYPEDESLLEYIYSFWESNDSTLADELINTITNEMQYSQAMKCF